MGDWDLLDIWESWDSWVQKSGHIMDLNLLIFKSWEN